MDEDEDFALALRLQEEWSKSDTDNHSVGDKWSVGTSNAAIPVPSSIVDPQWDLIDPNPDARALFIEFNHKYFWGKLDGVEVKWSPRMTLCAGVCSYEGRGGLCSIRLSVPLLQLRPRKDLVETLLHEMIHAYLFVTDNNKDHDGHGPEFCKHMDRINKQTGSNITIYHTFHDEVDNYRQHWWKCDGPCQKRPPYFGYVKLAMNRAPSARDPWWSDHQRKCGGTYVKVKEPEGYGEKKSKKKPENTTKVQPANSNMDIRDLFKKKTDTTSSTAVKDPEVVNAVGDKKNSSKQFTSWGGGTLLGSLKTPNNPPTASASTGPMIRRIPGIGLIRSERPQTETGTIASNIRDDKNVIQPLVSDTHLPESNGDTSRGSDPGFNLNRDTAVGTSGNKRKRPIERSYSSDSEDGTLKKAFGDKSKIQRKKIWKPDHVFDENAALGAAFSIPGFKSVSNRHVSEKKGVSSESLAANRNQRAHYLSSDSESDTDLNEQRTLGSVLVGKTNTNKSNIDNLPSSPAEVTCPNETSSLVSCPVCSEHVPQDSINAHLDTCLQ